ncbi:MAG: ABC transporter substrate-binding protein [Desulfarculus sp.]|nr:ABC transporter substrate-binding protein [Desulfarculus sp.]
MTVPRRLAALWAAAWLVLAGQALAAEPIKIGLVLPLTGGSAAYGEMALMGIRLAQAQGGQALGRPVELVLVDNKSDKVESSNAVNRLIQRDHVVAILGPLSSSEALAAAPVAEAAGVPLVTAWATNPLVTQGRVYIFRTCFIDPFQGGVAASFAVNHLKVKTAAVLFDVGRDYSVGLANFFKKSFASLGGQVVATVQYSEGDQDFSPQLMAIKAKDPEIIYLPGYLPEEPLVVRQARELGIKAPFLSGDAAQSDELIKIGGQAVEGLYFTTHFDEGGVTTPQGRQYAQAYRQKYGKAPDALGALGFDAYLLLLDAIGRAGSTQAQAVVKALETTKGFAGVCGLTDIVAHDAVKPAVILQVKEGEFVYVATVKP